MRRLLVPAILVSLVFAPTADAVLLGVAGDTARFQNQTGQRTDVNLVFAWWGGKGFLFRSNLGSYPMISFGTTRDGVQVITPRGIARGRGDSYLIALNRDAAAFSGPVYFRPLAEMNGHWNAYCAYNQSGSSRGESHSTKNFRLAFKRMYVILHGGTLAQMNARLARWDLPPVRSSVDLPYLPVPKVKVLWNPQGFGSPNLRGNSAQAYYPGDGFVDVVGNDLYDIRFRASWEANQALYDAHPGKPYAIGEWGLWGIDDPAFVRKMATFLRRHPRTEVAVYYESKRGSTFDLGSKPSSRAAYRTYVTPLGS